MSGKQIAYWMVLGYIGGTALSVLVRQFVREVIADGLRDAGRPRLVVVPPPPAPAAS